MIKICVDAGHGNEKRSKRTPKLIEDIYIKGQLVRRKGETINEYEFNAALRMKLVKHLLNCGFDVFTLDNGADIALPQRKKIIKKANCDFSLSIHFDAFKKAFNDVHGISMHIDNQTPSEFSKTYSEKALKRLCNIKEQKNRGFKSSNFALTNEEELGCYAVLCEHGFMTNREEIKLMLDEEFQEKCAIAHAKTICEIFNVDYVECKPILEQEITTENKYTPVQHMQVINVKNYLSIYSNPSKSSTNLGHLEPEQIVKYIDKKQEWYKVALLDGVLEGWVYSKYLKFIDYNQQEKPPEESQELESITKKDKLAKIIDDLKKLYEEL